MFDSLRDAGFQVEFVSHAQAIMGVDFPQAVAELERALAGTMIPINEIIAGGGGESRGTQRLRRALADEGWVKTNFVVERRINGIPRESQSHEVDHVRTFENGLRIALEIEWNNKDPFFDRDLENFKRLHADGAISVGVIVTRGRSLHANMRAMVRRFLDQYQVDDLDAMEQWDYRPTPRQKTSIMNRVNRVKNAVEFREAFTDQFVGDKFGEATTHWRKLEDRIHRGVGNPCPLVLIGLPDSVVTFPPGNSLGRPPEADSEEPA
jgi:hypothetical protein